MLLSEKHLKIQRMPVKKYERYTVGIACQDIFPITQEILEAFRPSEINSENAAVSRKRRTFERKRKMTSTDFHVEAIDRLCFVCGCIIMKIGHHILLVLKEAMSLTFERSINLLENVTSSNICHSCWTQEVSAIQRCPLFRGVRYSEVSAIQRCPLFRGARYSEVFI